VGYFPIQDFIISPARHGIHVAVATGWACSGRENPDSVSGLDDGRLDTVLDSRTDGVAGGPCVVVDIQLRHEMLPMFVHRFEGHAQFRGELFVGLAFGNQLEHLRLA